MSGSFVEQIRFVGGLPRISARVADEGFVSFKIDTGGLGSSLTLEHKIFDTLVRKGKIALDGPGSIIELNRESSVQRGVLETFELGPHRFHNLAVSAALSNTIECDFLNRFTVELDFPNRVARFRPGKQIDAKELSAPLGFSLMRKNGKMLIRVPNQSSTAAKAGMRTDDEILGVNDLTANELTPAKLLELRRIPGKEMRLRLIRDGVQREVVLKVPEKTDPFPGKPPHEVIVPAKAFDE